MPIAELLVRLRKVVGEVAKIVAHPVDCRLDLARSLRFEGMSSESNVIELVCIQCINNVIEQSSVVLLPHVGRQIDEHGEATCLVTKTVHNVNEAGLSNQCLRDGSRRIPSSRCAAEDWHRPVWLNCLASCRWPALDRLHTQQTPQLSSATDVTRGSARTISFARVNSRHAVFRSIGPSMLAVCRSALRCHRLPRPGVAPSEGKERVAQGRALPNRLSRDESLILQSEAATSTRATQQRTLQTSVLPACRRRSQ